jgi:hypothetical protein
LSVVGSWQAVIDSLSAGYRFLGRRVELVIIPVLLDFWLWLGPRLSVVPLLEDFVHFYERAATMQDMPAVAPGVSPQILLEAGQDTNLMDALVSGTLLHVPSLLATIGPVSTGTVYEITRPLAAVGLFTGLSIFGLLIGVLYMNLLARQLPLGSGTKPATASELLRNVLRQWVMVMLFILVMTLLLFAGALPVVMGSALLAFVSPALSSVLVFMYMGTVLVLFFYLYFVTTAIVLDDLPLHKAVMQSFFVVRGNFLATLLFIVLTTVISVGITLIVRQLTQGPSIGVAIAIVVNAYIGSGLALALFVFYRTRILRSAAAAGGSLGESGVNGSLQ